jgi:ankyrin repeat protein
MVAVTPIGEAGDPPDGARLIAELEAVIAAGSKEELRAALNAAINAGGARDIAAARDAKGRTALHAVLQAGCHDVVPLLMGAGADPLAEDEAGVSPLSTACGLLPKRDALQALLDGGLSPDARQPAGGPSLLQGAIARNDLALTIYLVERGADPALALRFEDPTGRDVTLGKNAYHFAAESTPEIMAFLLGRPESAAAGVFFTDNRAPVSALRLALRNGDRAMTALLLDHGIDVNETDENGETPLHFVLGHRKSREETMPLVRLLLARGADIDRRAANYWDETPLFAAVRDGFTEGALLLLDQGCDARVKNHQGETLLHAAAATYNAEIARALIAAGAPLEDKDRQGRTALHIAAHANRLEVVKTLLDAGADPFAKNKQGKTPDELCLADFQNMTRRSILHKQMELEAHGIYGRTNYGHGPRRQRPANDAEGTRKKSSFPDFRK